MSLIYFLSGILMLSLSNLMKTVIRTAFKLKLLQVLQTPDLFAFLRFTCVYPNLQSVVKSVHLPFISPSFPFKEYMSC